MVGVVVVVVVEAGVSSRFNFCFGFFGVVEVLLIHLRACKLSWSFTFVSVLRSDTDNVTRKVAKTKTGRGAVEKNCV